MAAGGITTFPTVPDDGGSSPFSPGSFKEPKRLYCKNGGYFLRINPDGRVDGIREKNDPCIKLQLQAESIGVVSIKGISANRYLAMNEDGRLFGTEVAAPIRNDGGWGLGVEEGGLLWRRSWSRGGRPALEARVERLFREQDFLFLFQKCATDECFFFERLESNNYNTYRSQKYPDWYVALKRTGQFKSGSKTGPGQKAILFLPMSVKS
ncbi:FGF2 factor, partial [Polyodon spathula]|nr:FGF2 factor [Polyodon spathula]